MQTTIFQHSKYYGSPTHVTMLHQTWQTWLVSYQALRKTCYKMCSVQIQHIIQLICNFKRVSLTNWKILLIFTFLLNRLWFNDQFQQGISWLCVINIRYPWVIYWCSGMRILINGNFLRHHNWMHFAHRPYSVLLHWIQTKLS